MMNSDATVTRDCKKSARGMTSQKWRLTNVHKESDDVITLEDDSRSGLVWTETASIVSIPLIDNTYTNARWWNGPGTGEKMPLLEKTTAGEHQKTFRKLEDR